MFILLYTLDLLNARSYTHAAPMSHPPIRTLSVHVRLVECFLFDFFLSLRLPCTLQHVVKILEPAIAGLVQ